jgi:hypothetical protein
VSREAGDKMYRAYYDADMALGYYVPALEMVVGREMALRHLRAKSPVPMRHGTQHRFTTEECERVIAYLEEILPAAARTPAAKAVALLANRICVMAMHRGEVYATTIRLYEQFILEPDVQKLVVETERGKLVGILEYPAQTDHTPSCSCSTVRPVARRPWPTRRGATGGAEWRPCGWTCRVLAKRPCRPLWVEMYHRSWSPSGLSSQEEPPQARVN